MLVLVIEYLILAAITVFASMKLSEYVDLLDKKTNLSGAFLGGVLLAAVTSLPEFFTSLTAILKLGNPGLVQGNVLGSNTFNMIIFGLVVFLYTSKYVKANIAVSHTKTLIFSIIMCLCVLGAVFMPFEVNIFGVHMNIFSIAIIVIYAISVKTMGADDSAENEEEDTSPLTVPQVIVRFLIFTVVVVGASIFLTLVADKLSVMLNLGATVGGALFLGVATSLPELSASFSLVKINNFNASVGNVVGSCCFNFIILGCADILYFQGNIYSYDPQIIIFASAGITENLSAMVMLKKQDNVLIAKIGSVLIIATYIASLALSM